MTGHLLVTGATGFIGHAVVQRLLPTVKDSLVVAVRHSAASFPAAVRVDQIDDLGPDTDWSASLHGVKVVVHCAARAHVMDDSTVDPLTEYRKINTQATLALARQAVQAGVRRFVFISSIKVSGERTTPGNPFRADQAPSPEDAYGISKHEAELGLMVIARESDMEVVLIRPPLVYGPGVKGNFASMVRWLRRGTPLPLGSVHNQRSLLALDNLVDFIALCSDPERSPRAANEVFLLSDGEHVSTTELLFSVARAYGVRARLIPVPVRWMRMAASLLGKGAAVDRLTGSLVVDDSKARDLLGWAPVVSMQEQLQKMTRYDSLF
jgi:nucleoside-diphosphate-sugar epimerase